MKSKEEVKKALEEAVNDCIKETSFSRMMPWDIHRTCLYLRGINACIATLQWVLDKEEK